MDLTTQWLGLSLRNPLVPAASPLTRSLDAAKQLEDAGAAAIVMHSLFEEVVQAEGQASTDFQQQGRGLREVDRLLPPQRGFPGELDRYLEQVAALKASLDIPVVASLNGVTAGGWMQHARDIRDAGADALELNAYYVAADVWEEGVYVEQRYLTLVHSLRETIEIPINMKLSPWFSSVGHMVKALEQAGVAGVSLFNRFYQPDINLDTLQLQHSLHPSVSADALLAMRWMAILRGRVDCSLGATGGVHSAEDVLKLLLAGADVVHLCTALLQRGPQHLGSILEQLGRWMEQHSFASLGELRGRMSQLNVQDPAEFERLNYIRLLDNYSFRPDP